MIKKLIYVQLGDKRCFNNSLNVAYKDENNQEHVKVMPISKQVFDVLEKHGYAVEG